MDIYALNLLTHHMLQIIGETYNNVRVYPRRVRIFHQEPLRHLRNQHQQYPSNTKHKGLVLEAILTVSARNGQYREIAQLLS